MYTSLGKLLLTWSELVKVLLDVEVNLNNQPLTDIEEDLEYSVLTPNSMNLYLHGSFQMTLQKRKNLVTTGRREGDIYINAKKQLGKTGFINTW